MKKILVFIMCCISGSCFAFAPNVQNIQTVLVVPSNCATAPATSDSSFCSVFKSVATCQCQQRGGGSFCQRMDVLYNAMMARYGTIDRACDRRAQQDTDPQTCITDWNYYNGSCPK